MPPVPGQTPLQTPMPVQTTTAPAFAGKAVPNKKKKQTNALLAALKGKK